MTGEVRYLTGRTSPGRGFEQNLTANAPVLILMDELMEYMTKASGGKLEDTTLAEQTLAFHAGTIGGGFIHFRRMRTGNASVKLHRTVLRGSRETAVKAEKDTGKKKRRSMPREGQRSDKDNPKKIEFLTIDESCGSGRLQSGGLFRKPVDTACRHRKERLQDSLPDSILRTGSNRRAVSPLGKLLGVPENEGVFSVFWR